MKLNKKGFMMAEVIVVSAIVLSFLAGIFISYNNIYKIYMTRLSYYDVAALYRIDFYQDYYADTFVIKKTDALRGNYAELPAITNNRYNEKAFLIHNNKANIVPTVLDSASIHPKYKDYLTYMSSSVDLTNTDYVLVIERCNKQDESQNDCKYAYLEVTDEP